MSATEPTNIGCVKPYKRLLLEAVRLRGRSGMRAFDRAKLLCAVFDDGEFRQECGNLDDFRAAEILDEYVDDLCLGFLDLRAMLAHYPRRRQWAAGKLGRMLSAMIHAGQAVPATRAARTATAETRKQLERALEEARREKARLAQTKDLEIERLRLRVAELETEVASLRAKLAAPGKWDNQGAEMRRAEEEAVAAVAADELRSLDTVKI